MVRVGRSGSAEGVTLPELSLAAVSRQIAFVTHASCPLLLLVHMIIRRIRHGLAADRV